MGRHDASAGRVVPVQPVTNMVRSGQVFYEAVIQVALEFADKDLPRGGRVRTETDITVDGRPILVVSVNR